MSSLVSSVGNMVEAGVKGLIGFAETYYTSEEEGDERQSAEGQGTRDEGENHAKPVPISTGDRERSQTDTTVYSASASTSSSATSSSIVSKPVMAQGSLVQILDVPSGWIHLQSTYLDGAGARKVRSFGLKNLADKDVEVTIGSDLVKQILFWAAEDESTSSSASSVSSVSNSPGTPGLTLTVPALSTTTVHLSFQPSQSISDSPRRCPSPSPSDGGFTPRTQGASRSNSSDVLPVPSVSNGNAPSETSTSSASVTGSTNHSVANGRNSSIAPSKRNEPIHRAFSVHGSISIHATESPYDVETPLESRPLAPASTQMLNLPFFATVCRSLFTAALIDPATGLASGSQLSSGQLVIDFGGDPVVGSEYHRDILLVNRSEIELVWSTAVVNSRSKDSVWFSLRDLDSENVFGVDHSSQPMPLPALSSRHLRLELRVKAPVVDFDFDFVLSNIHQLGNTVTCRAVGSGQAEGSDDSLKIVSGTALDFGQINDGAWAKKMITCKNAGDRPLDVAFSATPDYDVVFQLAGVAGDDMDEDLVTAMPNDRERERKHRGDKASETHSRMVSEQSRGKDYVSSLRSSRPSSPSRSHDPSTSGNDAPSSDGLSVSEIFRQLTGTKSEASHGGGSSVGASARDHSRPPSTALSRVTSRTSSHRYHSSIESDEEEEADPPFFGGDATQQQPVAVAAPNLSPERSNMPDGTDRAIPNQLEEITMRPGTEYRIFVLYRPARDTSNVPEVAGALRQSSFKVYLDSCPSGSRSTASPRFKRTINCTAESCTSIISLTSGAKIDFGEVTVGASKSSTLSITNMSALLAKIEIAAISKVLNTNRNVIVIPPHETVEEKIEFFPRRINDKYEKQMFVRNLLNRANDQLVEIKSKNVDVHNLTLHSHLYRILTPSGSNFLDFASVVINSPTVRTVLFENLSTTAALLLELSASQPEDVELFLKAEDAPQSTLMSGKYADEPSLARVTSPPNGELKERFMETMRELSSGRETTVKPSKAKGKTREKSSTRTGEGEAPKQSVGAAVAAALKKGGRGRPVQLYGNAVVFKDRNLLESHEYLDLAAGPPVSAHRTSPRSKKFQLLDTIEYEDKSKLSGQHPKIPKLDFAAGAKATGLLKKVTKKAKSPAPVPPQTPTKPEHTVPSSFGALARALLPTTAAEIAKSPALTAKRADPKTELSHTSDVNKMTVEDLLLAIEQHDTRRASITHSTLEEEEAFVRRTISLRKELASLTTSGKLVSARNISIPPGSNQQLIVVMTPNGSTRPHITTRAKRADSRVYIKLLDFDRSKLSNANTNLGDLPVRDLIIRSSCVRSVLEVQQSSINFGTCEKGEVKSKTIVIHNKSDAVGLFRLRTSGSIASGDLKLGLGRYGVISAFGRKEVENFSFTPSLSGTYNENIVIENVLDTVNDQNVAVKANVRKAPTFTIEPPLVDFGSVDSSLPAPDKIGFTLTNVSKHERTFVVSIKPFDGDSTGALESERSQPCFVDLSLSRDDVGTALSKTEEEEIENIQQKLKIAKRKKKKDKVAKYESRLVELGQPLPPDTEDNEAGDDAASESTAGESSQITAGTGTGTDTEPQTPTRERTDSELFDDAEADADGGNVEYGPKARVSTLSVVLQPNQKNRILVELLPRLLEALEAGSNNVSSSTTTTKEQGCDLDAIIEVHDKKNADESQSVKVKACRKSTTDITSAAMASHNGPPNASGVNSNQHSSTTSKASSTPSNVLPISQDALHTALMRHCLELTHQCVVSPTAFCVGSCLFLPITSPNYPALAPHFEAFSTSNAPEPAGLILANGYSRQIPGNTHAEANALTNFQSRLLQLHSSADGRSLPSKEEILKDVDCYATMEPCSVRTSGGPSCATELVKAGVKGVWLGVEEPPDFVQCQGVNILLEGKVQVGRVQGLEEDCLKAARRGRD